MHLQCQGWIWGFPRLWNLPQQFQVSALTMVLLISPVLCNLPCAILAQNAGHCWCHTLKKSKNEMCFTMGPYRLSSCLKKKKLVKAASMSSGCFLLSFTSSSLSLRLSRPRQRAVEFLLSQGGPVLACTDIISRLTLEDRKCTRSSQLSCHKGGWKKTHQREHSTLTGPWFLEQSRSGHKWASRYPWNPWSHTRKRSDGCLSWISFFPKASLPN